MKKQLLITLSLFVGLSLAAQQPQLKPNLKSAKANLENRMAVEPQNPTPLVKSPGAKTSGVFKKKDAVSVISIGTSANAYGYGYGGGQRSLVTVNNDLNTVTNFHRMGGDLDPSGFSGDMGYDISTDGGSTFTNMVECYLAPEPGPGQWYLLGGRYPNHGIYNPPGNTDPNSAYLAFIAAVLDGSNEPDGWGGYAYGIHHIGSPSLVDTTMHLISSNNGIYLNIPDGFAMVNANAEYWVTDFNLDMSGGSLVYLNEMIISRGVWDEMEEDFHLETFLMDCETTEACGRPVMSKVEFSPDGQYGYIVVLADNGEVPISENRSYYPILWRTDDGGVNWEGPIEVPLAGPDGIGEVQWFLSDEEIAELFDPPSPARDEIPFTTAFDFDLSVDLNGNPCIAVMVGVTGSDAYSIVTGISPSSRYMYTDAFLLHSVDKGMPGSWFGHEMGRPVSFRGEFETDFTEDNRIQIARTPAGDKMFVAWLDTDTTVSAENNAPDIWSRGIDLVTNSRSLDANGENRPVNVTFGSEATFSAYFFAMGNEVFVDDNGTCTIPFVYENMTPTDPVQPVQFKYIQDFTQLTDEFFLIDVQEIPDMSITGVSAPVPNPVVSTAKFNVTLVQPAMVSVIVTNMMGQTMREIPARDFAAGKNSVTLDVSGLPAGVYFYTVKTGNNNMTKKVIVK